MSRRKQAKPIRHSDEFGVEQCVIGNKAENEMCVSTIRSEPLAQGRNKNGELHVNGSFSVSGDRTGTSVSGSVSPIQDESESEQEQDDRQYEDSTNNNQSRKRERDFANESSDEDNRVPESTSEALRMANPFLNGNALEAAYSPYLPPAANLANVNNALDALQSTRMAIAQFAATAFANGSQNPNSLQELASLQSTLYALHQQQFLQMQLIHQLQQQLQLSAPEITKSEETERKQNVDEESVEAKKEYSPPQLTKVEHELQNHKEPLPSLADSILQTSEPLPAPDAPSTLEMLQRSTQQVLNNASQGLLSSNLADELGFRAASSAHSGDGKGGKDSMFKHRCRYCGKVFSSDSALQIHIRSHTGERPFKCNICGNRFTTKGNLKVHFQRHAARFPHVKMNPHPVPEHLDRFHPPLLAQLEMDESSPSGAKSPGSNGPVTNAPLTAPGHNFPHPPMGVIPNFPSPLYRSFNPDLIRARHQLIFNPEILEKEEVILEQQRTREQDLPENLTKVIKEEKTGEVADYQSAKLEDSRCEEKQEVQTDNVRAEDFADPRCRSFDECSVGSKYSSDEGMNQEMDEEEMQNDSSDEAPENLSSKPPQLQQPLLPPFLPPHLRFPIGMPGPTGHIGQFREGPPLLHTNQGPILLPPDVDPAKDPAIYTNLLPRPGSNDNAWESLIEVTKASETSKLQQLVDSIENKLTDPNQCVICHRVLSCKSALQMHYRTHTGERPFKCKICGRAFTTKGNLKTHMGVHRAKPPTRLLHICPVCHRKFTNGIVLQQHIRLHTGEPTDLTHEQIQAAEVRDFPIFPMMGGYPNPFFGMPPFSLRLPMEDSEKSLNFCTKSEKGEARPGSPQESNPSEAGLPLASPNGSERRQDSLSEREEKKMSLSESESSHSDEYRAKSSQSSFTPLDLTSMSHIPALAVQGNVRSPRSSPLSSLTNASLPTTFNPLNLPVAPGRGNTTCNICFKTFACHSALEIHYRSHTKERPFKCSICDRGFSTKGNMKQHMMTHKGVDGDLPKMSKSLPPCEGSQEERPNSQQSLPESRVSYKQELDTSKEKMHAFSVFAQFRHKDFDSAVQNSPVGYWGNFIKQEGGRRLSERTSPQSQGRMKTEEETCPDSPIAKSVLTPDYSKSGVYGLSTTNSASELDLSTKSSVNFAQHANRHMLPLP